MEYQEEIIRLTLKANADLLRIAQAMPLEKLEWQPLDRGRPALNLLQECAQVPGLLAQVLERQNTDWFTDQTAAEGEQERLTLSDLESCKELLAANTERLIAAIRSLPEDALPRQVTLPFGAGGDWSLAEIIQAHYWNTTYHIGQIGYIQTLYGDTESH